MSRRKPSEMIVHLREIPQEGLVLELDLSGAFARDALAGTEVLAAAGLRSGLELHKVHDNVQVRGKLTGEVTLACSRCTQPATLSIDEDVRVTYVPRLAEEEAAGQEVEIAEDDLELSTYAEDEIDLAALLREQLLLALPMSQLCREECLGLCNQCGADLNAGSCDCPPAPEDPRWAALKNIKL